jgi:hypothetical protein
VDESRKRVLGIMTAILAARKLAQYDGGKRVPATVATISDAVWWTEEIMKEIEGRWPTKSHQQLGWLDLTGDLPLLSPDEATSLSTERALPFCYFGNSSPLPLSRVLIQHSSGCLRIPKR